jgi:hypothetical protein
LTAPTISPPALFSFAVVNKSSRSSPADLLAYAQMTEAVVIQANGDFSAAWGIAGVRGVFLADGDTSKLDPQTVIFTLKDNETSVPGAAGFHDEQGGKPYAEVLLDPVIGQGGGLLDGGTIGMSLASVLAHEVFEAVVDLYIDDWVQMPNGKLLAKEVCDPVQGSLVPVTLSDGTVVQSSNAVTPRYFDAQAPTDGTAAFDLVGAVTAPFQLPAGGYQIVLDPAKANDPNGGVSNVFGAEVPTWLQAYRNREAARSAKRAASQVKTRRMAAEAPPAPRPVPAWLQAYRDVLAARDKKKGG